ncbi:MAG TPA: DNA topoisomerase IB [Thermoanaerobaculia bacterium]
MRKSHAQAHAAPPARPVAGGAGGRKVQRLQATGFRRRGAAKHFTYATADGRRPSFADRTRIRSLAIPPAWTEVAIAASAASALQAVGRDRAGRWQYVYHPARVRAREREKRERLIAFIQALPALRAAVRRGLSGTDLSRERVLCAIVRILSVSFLRPGSAVYARENDTYGLATLRPRHVTVHGDRVVFDFPGKGGKRQRHELVDRQVASVVRGLLRIPSREVFQYHAEDGKLVNVRRRDINAFLREITGRKFTAKDFRTWAGTLLCAVRLSRRAEDSSAAESQRKRAVREELREVAAALGNTPAVCRASYVCPVVLRTFERGRLSTRRGAVDLSRLAHRNRLSAEERALLKLLRG